MLVLVHYKNFISIFLTILILYSCSISCQSDEMVAKHISVESANYSSEDVFKGIFFLEGEFVSEIPSLNNLKIKREQFISSPIYKTNFVNSSSSDSLFYTEEEKQQMIDSLRNFLLQEINMLNPNIMDELYDEIQMGNPDSVNKKLLEVGHLFKAALFKIDPIKDDISLLEDAYKNGGIDPKDYDFTDNADVQQFNSDIQIFIDNNTQYENYLNQDAWAVVLLVYVVMFMFWAILAAVFLFGEFLIFYFNLIFIYNAFLWADENPEEGTQLTSNLIILDLINFFQNE
ncbi:MAG: hypothetical protein CMO34_05450 [Verrucomicrobia bacterium]|nr:hypothetical protein [Verrucomicrobiota bacterium]